MGNYPNVSHVTSRESLWQNKVYLIIALFLRGAVQIHLSLRKRDGDEENQRGGEGGREGVSPSLATAVILLCLGSAGLWFIQGLEV